MKITWKVYFLATLILTGGCQISKQSQQQPSDKEHFDIYSIGRIKKKDNHTFIVIDKEYEPGLKGLDKHDYVTVVYWFDRNDTLEKRTIPEETRRIR